MLWLNWIVFTVLKTVPLIISKALLAVSSFYEDKAVVRTPWNRKVCGSFEHLRKEHVIWLNARITLCENLRDLGFTVSTDSVDTCRNILHVAIQTEKFVLVIDDAQVAPVDSPIFSLYEAYGAKHPQFRVFLTVSDHKLYYRRLHDRVQRTAIEITVFYPSRNVLEELCKSYNVSDFEKVFSITGPSLGLIDNFVRDETELRLKCLTAERNLRHTCGPLLPVLLKFTRNFTNDYSALDLTKLSVTEDQFEILLAKNVVFGDYDSAFSMNPLFEELHVLCFKIMSYHLVM
ncbi:hypothetical protein GEMRC1_001453 [Eukaryota sp. GEM-RC1]